MFDFLQSQLNNLIGKLQMFNFPLILLKQPLIRYCFQTFKNKKGLVPKQSKNSSSPLPNFTKQQTMSIYLNNAETQLAKQVAQLPLKQFAIKIHHLLVSKEKSPVFWSTVQKSFLQQLTPTSDPVKIRSYAKIIYALSKSKQATGNYQTNIGLLLPFATPPSFTTMVTAASRIAPLSSQFTYIVQKLYYKRKSQFNARQLVSVNYSLAHNGRPCDINLIDHIDSFNCVQTITMLRCYDLSNQITPEILLTTLKKLKSIKNEFNVLDLADFVNIFLKHKFKGEGFQQMVQQSYFTLKRNVNDICLEKIWQHMPTALNEGRVRIKFVESVIQTILILRKGRNMGEIVWKRIRLTFDRVENIEIKLKLQKIY